MPTPGDAKAGGRSRRGFRHEAARILEQASQELKDALSEELAATSATAEAKAGEATVKATAAASAIAISLQKAARSLDEAAAKVASSSTKAQRTRQSLLEAGADVIAERGYEGASVGDIAEAAGFTKGAVYAHFAAKENLFAEVLAQASVEQVRVIEEAEAPVLASIAAHVARAGDTRVARTALLAAEARLFAARRPDWRDEVAGFERRRLLALARRISAERTGRAPGTPPREDLLTATQFLAAWDRVALAGPLGLPASDAAALAVIARRLGEARPET